MILQQGLSVRNKPILINEDTNEEDSDSTYGKHGAWIRRRRLDGSLNRVPVGFYSKVWMALEKCRGIQIYGYVLYTELTREMTREEIKFALLVEEALNRIPEPEYRQVVVEACMLATLLSQNEAKFYLNEIIVIDTIIDMANKLFIQDQIKFNGDSMLCCASGKFCNGAKLICEHFYDLGKTQNRLTGLVKFCFF